MSNDYDNPKPFLFPSLEDFLRSNVDWLMTAVDTKGASALLSIPEPTLTTWRSTRTDGPTFCHVGSRMVRYLRIDLLRWLFRRGRKTHNGDPGEMIDLDKIIPPDNDN